MVMQVIGVKHHSSDSFVRTPLVPGQEQHPGLIGPLFAPRSTVRKEISSLLLCHLIQLFYRVLVLDLHPSRHHAGNFLTFSMERSILKPRGLGTEDQADARVIDEHVRDVGMSS